MSTRSRSVVVCAALGLLLSACGGGGTSAPPPPPPPPPPAPAALVKQGGDNQNGTVSTAVATPPSVKVTTASGAGIQGVVVTFVVASGGGTLTGATPTSGSDGVATVGSWTLGSGAGPNTVTASIAASGVTGNPATFTATGQLAVFNPSANANLSGTQNYASVNIPVGVTITATGHLVMNSTGAVTIAGTVTGNCVNITVTGDTDLNITGTVANECTDLDADGTPIKLFGKATWTLNGATIASSGDISIANDPTRVLPALTELVPEFLRLPQPRMPSATSWRCRKIGGTLEARPLKRKKAADGGVTGGNGRAGASAQVDCGFAASGQSGGSLLLDGVTIKGGSGGDGGNASSTSSTPAVGGDGGVPGAIVISADDDVDLRGTVTLLGGSGGKGGDATATAPGGNPGANATATGGKGGELKPRNFSSPIRLVSRQGSISQTGHLAVVMGTAGAGGAASANGGAGNPGNPGAKGGDATANGGNGGESVPVTLNASGSVSLNGTRNLSGGNGGAGGKSTKTPGKGGDGNVPGASGGPGGNAFGKGGNGGKGQPAAPPPSALRTRGSLAFAGDVLDSEGGKAGNSDYFGGLGGNGAANCPNAGGGGGAGGGASGGGGDRGTGTPAGALAAIVILNAFNGGNGAAGGGPAGAGGGNAVTLGSGATGSVLGVNSFLPGLPGGACPPQLTGTGVAPTNPTVTAGASATASANFTRINYTGPVTGTMLSAGGATLGTGSTSLGNSVGLSYTVPIGTTAGANTFTFRLSAAVLANVDQPFPLMVTSPAPPATVNGDLNTIIHTGSIVSFGLHTMNLTVSGVTRGTIQVQTVFNTGNHFWSNTMPAGLRVGAGNGNGFRANFTSAQVDGAPYSIVGMGYCLLNMSMGGGGAVINVRNNADAIIQTQSVTSLPNGNAGPLCQWTTIPPDGRSAEILAPIGSGLFVDFGSWSFWTVNP